MVPNTHMLRNFLPIILLLTQPTRAGQLFHPETVFPSLVKPGFTLQLDAGGSLSIHEAASARFTESSTMVFRRGAHIGGLVSKYTFEWNNELRERNDGVLDLRYYAIFAERFHFKAFFAAAFNEPSRLDYLLMGGPGFGILLAAQRPFLCQVGFVIPVGGLSHAHSVGVGAGIFPYASLSWDFLKRFLFESQVYGQCLWTGRSFLFSLPWHMQLEFALTPQIRIGFSYLFLWDAASMALPLTHDLYFVLRLRV